MGLESKFLFIRSRVLCLGSESRDEHSSFRTWGLDFGEEYKAEVFLSREAALVSLEVTRQQVEATLVPEILRPYLLFACTSLLYGRIVSLYSKPTLYYPML